MTIDEAIEILKNSNPNIIAVRSCNERLFDKRELAYNMATQSLKAWEKLIKFADSEKENNGTLRVHINDIKKFYKEVSE